MFILDKRKKPVTNPVDENEESQQSAVEIFTLLSCGNLLTINQLTIVYLYYTFLFNKQEKL